MSGTKWYIANVAPSAIKKIAILRLIKNDVGNNPDLEAEISSAIINPKTTIEARTAYQNIRGLAGRTEKMAWI